jgi:hypothetical protein
MKKTDVKQLVETIVVKNPETLANPKYLMLEVLEAQGVRFYPHQREAILGDGVASPETILRAKRHARIKLEDIRKKQRARI